MSGETSTEVPSGRAEDERGALDCKDRLDDATAMEGLVIKEPHMTPTRRRGNARSKCIMDNR